MSQPTDTPAAEGPRGTLGDGLERLIVRIGQAASWLILAILGFVLLSILGGLLGTTRFLDWDGEVFLLGPGMTLNTVLELQWHLFGAMLMLTLAYAVSTDRHVRVDVVSSRLSPRGRLWVEVVGDLCLLLPMCLVMIDRSLPLLELSWRTGERSNEDGLTDRWLIKSFAPLGFALMGLVGATRIARHLRLLFGGRDGA